LWRGVRFRPEGLPEDALVSESLRADIAGKALSVSNMMLPPLLVRATSAEDAANHYI
jgi:hypothetical protein